MQIAAPDSPTTNRNIALEFLRVAGSAGNPRKAFRDLVAPGFVHHNPYFGGTTQELLDGMEAEGRKSPRTLLDVRHVLTDGEMTAVHTHVRRNARDPGFAAVHLFRIRDGKIVELWDVVQAVPRSSRNLHGMF